MRLPTLFLCGAGNPDGVRLALTLNRNPARWERIVLLDDDIRLTGSTRLGVRVDGPIDLLHHADRGQSEAANLVARSTRVRDAVRRRIEAAGVPFTSLVGPGVDRYGVDLAGDVVVYDGARLGAEARLEAGTCVFPGAVVGHEAQVGPGVVIAPNAVVNARVILGRGAYVGSNATILPDVRIGAWATVGAGSAVIGNLPDACTAVGVPAEVMVDHQERESPGIMAGPFLDAAAAEALVIAVWRELLGAQSIDRLRSFFDLGGTSLMAMRARERLRQATGMELDIVDLYRHPTAQSLARYLTTLPGPAVEGTARGLLRRAARSAPARGRPRPPG